MIEWKAKMIQGGRPKEGVGTFPQYVFRLARPLLDIPPTLVPSRLQPCFSVVGGRSGTLADDRAGVVVVLDPVGVREVRDLQRGRAHEAVLQEVQVAVDALQRRVADIPHALDLHEIKCQTLLRRYIR